MKLVLIAMLVELYRGIVMLARHLVSAKNLGLCRGPICHEIPYLFTIVGGTLFQPRPIAFLFSRFLRCVAHWRGARDWRRDWYVAVVGRLIRNRVFYDWLNKFVCQLQAWNYNWCGWLLVRTPYFTASCSDAIAPFRHNAIAGAWHYFVEDKFPRITGTEIPEAFPSCGPPPASDDQVCARHRNDKNNFNRMDSIMKTYVLEIVYRMWFHNIWMQKSERVQTCASDQKPHAVGLSSLFIIIII
jgi:hypothetical protein